MGVVLIPSSVEPVGVATHILNLARLLKDANLLDIVVCPAEGWLSEQLRQEDLPYHILHISYKPLHFLHSNFALFQFLRKGKSFQVVHLHGRFPLFVSMLSMIMLKHLEFFVTVHQFRASAKAGLFAWKNWLETLIWRSFIKKISCVSESLKEEVIERLGDKHASKVSVIRNWIQPLTSQSVIDTCRLMRADSGYFKIIAVGRLVKEKGFDILVDAIRIVMGKGYQVECDIFGTGPEKPKLAAQINKYSLGTVIGLQGVCENVRSIMPLYNLLVVPSRMESFGIVILEAYDAGVPVIASDLPSLNEIVQAGKTGLLFTVGNSESLAQQIIYLMNSTDLRNSLIVQGKEVVKSYYANKELLNRYLDFYDLQR